MGKCDENGSGMGEAMQLAAAKQQYAEHMDSLRAEVGNFTYAKLSAIYYRSKAIALFLTIRRKALERNAKKILCPRELVVCAIIVFLRVISD
jgi:hypothetical protein